MPDFPPISDLSRPLSEAEFDELSAALEALPEERNAFDLSMLEGYLAGVLLQPEVVMPSNWLPPVFGAREGEPLIPGDEAEVARMIELVMRHYNTLAAHIAAREPFDPVLWTIETDDGAPPTREQELTVLWPWALGFDDACFRFTRLDDLAEVDLDLQEAIEQVYRHLPVDPEKDDEATRALRRERDLLDREDPIADLDDGVARLVEAVLDIADISRPREPTVRSQPKVGRNDPCPCGSGRKFKQCHGRDAG